MGDLQKGVTFVDGTTYAAADLNNLVDNATIISAAITGKSSFTPALTDPLIYYSSSQTALKKATFQDIVNLVPSGSVAATPALRALGTGSTQAAAGNDARFPTTITGLRQGNGASADTAAVPKNLSFAPVALGGGFAINWDSADMFTDTLSGSGTLTYTFSNTRSGRIITVILKKGTWTGTSIVWPTLVGATPSIDTSKTVFVFTFAFSALGTICVGSSI